MIRILAFLAALFALAPTQAHAQASVALFCFTGQSGVNAWQPCSSTWPLATSTTVTVSGFAPNGNFATLTATASSANVALPAGTSVQFQNTGTTAVSCTLGIGSATALASELVIQSGSTKVVVVGANTFGACIDQTGSASNVVVLAGGAGLGNDSGGGGSSGGGGAVTLASGAVSAGAYAAGALAAGALAAGSGVDGWDLTQGAKADAACANSGSSCTISSLLHGILGGVQSSIPAQPNTTTNIGAISGIVNVTQTDCSIALTTGATAQNIITAAANIHGFRIMNIDASAGSGEPVWISFTTTAAASTIASYPLAAPTATTFAGAGSYSAEFASGINTSVSVIAATTGHKISCTKW